MPRAIEGRLLVVILQSRQPLTVDPAEAVTAEDGDLVVLTDGDPESVVREDVHLVRASQVVSLARESWLNQVQDWAATRPVQVVTNDEYCVRSCAELRRRLDLPQRHPEDPANYLDKVVMKRKLREAGVEVPAFYAFEPVVDADDETLVLEVVGIPAVAKPREEANSRGIAILRSASELRSWLALHDGESGWQIDAFVEGPLGHVNSVVRDGTVTPVQAGQYAGPLLGVDDGQTLGGWIADAAEPWVAQAHELNTRVATALGSQGRFVIHTEFARTRSGRLVVLETAARAPGASVSALARHYAGLELEVANLRLQADLPVPDPRPGSGPYGAWLWFAVMPGRKSVRSDVGDLELSSTADVHVRRVALQSNDSDGGLIGASLILLNQDSRALQQDITTSRKALWFA